MDQKTINAFHAENPYFYLHKTNVCIAPLGVSHAKNKRIHAHHAQQVCIYTFHLTNITHFFTSKITQKIGKYLFNSACPTACPDQYYGDNSTNTC